MDEEKTNPERHFLLQEAIDLMRAKQPKDALPVLVQYLRIHPDSEEGWFLLTNSPCTHLLPDGRCGIYEKRPLICREYDNQDCEFNTQAGEEDFELYFPSYESLDRYCRKRFKHWDQRFKKWEKGR